ncbi:hypothetical protein LOSG293_110320 [Secundilactobacillus oryzae JCM 18671]|uniref:Uncharacterized protein n=1 Tax=Secundilactobacillus oryzae JCM 18671 TaxID=1291743 RepID=A0A081BI48_9LACO|nr:hypothetical protein [Secundilactobacillus oryzae]GAK47716.1 hypothetical protein LOSG293_110320 [Secundilactobacillus oryzae JCM 18671]
MKKSIFGGTDILIDDRNATTLSGMVDDPSLTADADGQKYLRAGTLLTSNKDFANTDDGSAVLTPTTDASKAQGILRNDYNIVEGAQPASIIVAGTVNIKRMDDETAKLYTAALQTALKPVLPKVTFITRD